MKSILLFFLLQSASLPPRAAQTNPASFTEVPKAIQKDYNKFWTRFQTGKDKDDPGLTKDLDKFLKKNPAFTPVITIEAYIDEIHGRMAEAEQKFGQVLALAPNDRIALSYVADRTFERQEYPRAVELYDRLLQADPARTDVEPKRQKAMILGTDSLLRQAAQAEQGRRFTEAESFYRQALRLAPGEPSLYARLGALLASQKNWAAALTIFEKQRELAGPSEEVQRHIAEALTGLGRVDEARSILASLEKPSTSSAPAGGNGGNARNSQLEDLGRWGKDIDRFRQIQAAPSITREQFALLMVRYFPQIADLRPTVRGIVVTDIQNSIAQPEIQIVLGLGLMDSFPNHTFRPLTPINRGDLATVGARLAKLLAVPPPPSAAAQIPMPDVNSSNARYRDVQFVLSLGIMAPGPDGNFNIGGPVSGNEALRAVQRLLDLSK